MMLSCASLKFACSTTKTFQILVTSLLQDIFQWSCENLFLLTLLQSTIRQRIICVFSYFLHQITKYTITFSMDIKPEFSAEQIFVGII